MITIIINDYLLVQEVLLCYFERLMLMPVESRLLIRTLMLQANTVGRDEKDNQ